MALPEFAAAATQAQPARQPSERAAQNYDMQPPAPMPMEVRGRDGAGAGVERAIRRTDWLLLQPACLHKSALPNAAIPYLCVLLPACLPAFQKTTMAARLELLTKR